MATTLTSIKPLNLTITDSYTFGNATVTANVSAGNLKTDNLLYANGTAWTFSNYSNTNVASYLPTYTGNITGNIVTLTGNVTSINANLGNLVTSNYFTGNGSLLTSLTGANVTGTVANSTYATSAGTATSATTAATVTTAAQPNITSLGTLTSLTASGLITATAGGIKVGNIQDPSGTNTISLASGNVTMIGNLQVGTGGTGNVTATYFIGNGSQLTGLPATYANSNVAAYLPTYTGNITGNTVTLTGNVTAVNSTLSGTLSAANITTSGSSGNITGANYIVANYFQGNGSGLSSITGANVSGQVGNSLVAGTVYTNSQPNITSVGTLSSLSVTGDTTLTGNLTVSGTFEYANVTSFKVKDPIIEQGGNTAGGALTTNDGYDRGQLLHYYSGAAIDAFMGWDNSNAEFAFGSNVSVTSETVTFNTFGNVRAGYFLGNASQLTGTIANANYAAYAGNVTQNAQPNITSVGTLTSLTITGNITSGNANLGNLVTANYFTGNGSLLTAITGGNVTGTVANATYATSAGSATTAATVTTAAQPNITSLGTVSSLTVTANVDAGNIRTDHLLYANGTAYAFTSNASGSNTQIQFNDSNAFAGSASLTFDKTSNTLTANNFVVSTHANLGAVGNIYIGGGTADYVLKTDGAGNLSWTAQTGGGATSTTIAVDNFTGNGVADTYTLSVTPTSVNSVFVNYNGAFVGRGSYSLDGANLTFGSIPADGASIEITTIEGLTIGSGAFTARTATGDNSTVNYTVTSGATVSSVLVTLDGVLQTPTTDYTISGSTLTFTTAPYNGAAIQIRELSVASSSSGGGSALLIQEEGSNLTATANTINFVGDVVTATNVGNVVTVTVSGASNTSIRAQAMTMGIIFGG